MRDDLTRLTDPAHLTLGYTSTNQLGQRELRTPEGILLGHFDAKQNVTRDQTGFIVGYGDQLSCLLVRDPLRKAND